MPDVHGKDFCSARLEQAIGETSGGSAKVNCGQALGGDFKMLQRVVQLVSAATDKLFGGGERELIACADVIAGFASGLAVDQRLAGHDGAFGLLTAFTNAALHQSLIHSHHPGSVATSGSKITRETVTERKSNWAIIADGPFEIGLSGAVLSRGSGVEARLNVGEAVQEHRVVGDGFLDQLMNEEQLGAVDDGVYTMLERLHRSEGLERFPDEDDRGVPPLADGHALQRLQRQVFFERVRGKAFFDDDHLVVDLAEADQKVAVCRGGVNLVAELLEGLLDFFQPFGRGEGEQRGLVRSTDEIKLVAHDKLLDFNGRHWHRRRANIFHNAFHAERADVAGDFAARLAHVINAAGHGAAFGAVEQGGFF